MPRAIAVRPLDETRPEVITAPPSRSRRGGPHPDRVSQQRAFDEPSKGHRSASDRPSFSRDGRSSVGYLRRSTDRQEQSIADQRRAVERFAAEQGFRILRFYIDDGISGTSVVGRKAFQELIADAQRGGTTKSPAFRYVIVYDVKRFGRVDVDEAGYYRHILKKCGVEVLYTSEGFSGGETDDLLRPVKQWQARQESKDLSKVTIRGLVSKAKSGGGHWMGGVPPYGYDLRYESAEGQFLSIIRYMPDGTKQMLGEDGALTRTLARGESVSVTKRDRASLVSGAHDRVGVIRRIFSLYTERMMGLKAITNALNADRVPTPRGPGWGSIHEKRRTWSDSTVRAILVNPLYAGDMVWNRRTDARFHMIRDGLAVARKDAYGARLVPNDETEWLIARGTHEALVSRSVFERARAIREGRPDSARQLGVPKRVVGGWSGARARFMLSGLARCACCGSRYQGVTRRKGTPKRDGTYIRTYYYACGGYISKGRSVCEFNAVGQAALETAVIEAVLGFYKQYDGAEGRERMTTAVRAALGAEATDLADARKRLQAEHRDVESKIATLLDNITPATRDLVEQRLDSLRHDRDRLRLRGDELEALAAEEREVQSAVGDAGRFLVGLSFTLNDGAPAERTAAIRQCVHRVAVDKPRGVMTICLRRLPAAGSNASGETELVVRLDAACKPAAAGR